MKLIIDIPEEIYKSCKAIYKMPVKKEVADAYTYAIANVNAYTYPIANGIPLPKGHGDLVDRDKVIDLLNEQEYNYYTELDKVCDTVYEAPTIIEADKGGEK